MVMRDPENHLNKGGYALEFEWSEHDSRDADVEGYDPDPGEWYLPIGGEFELEFFFGTKVLKEYPELLGGEFMGEVLEALYNKLSPQDFLLEVAPPEWVSDVFEHHKDDHNPPHYKVRIQGYQNVKVTRPRPVGDPHIDGNFVTLKFRLNASFDPEYKVSFDEGVWAKDQPTPWRYQQNRRWNSYEG
jgi:hypothetical protein